jgi:hypothetical protein
LANILPGLVSEQARHTNLQVASIKPIILEKAFQEIEKFLPGKAAGRYPCLGDVLKSQGYTREGFIDHVIRQNIEWNMRLASPRLVIG